MTEKSMLDGGEINAEEILAIQLFYTYATENGEIERAQMWLKDLDPLYFAIQKWIQMASYQRDVWRAVAVAAQRLVEAK